MLFYLEGYPIYAADCIRCKTGDTQTKLKLSTFKKNYDIVFSGYLVSSNCYVSENEGPLYFLRYP